jgi:hypothetical protein
MFNRECPAFGNTLLGAVLLTNTNKMEEVKLSNGMMVLKSNYIKLKTKDLKEFGYTNLTENEVAEQVEKILKKEDDLSVIGMFCKDDFDVE